MNSLGVDLAGFQSKATAVVRLNLAGGEARFEVVRTHPFNEFDENSMTISQQIEREIAYLQEIYRRPGISRIVIDAPIDLSQMPVGLVCDDYSLIQLDESQSARVVPTVKESWRLRMRPVDQAFGGQSPIFSFLGSVTLRARLAMAKCHGFESYPKISQRLAGFSKRSPASILQAFREYLEGRGVSLTAEASEITGDEFDAIWCALSGISLPEVAESHEGASKFEAYRSLVGEWTELPWPKNYRLLCAWPGAIKSVRILR